MQVGTANFVDPACMVRILDDLRRMLAEAGTSVAEVSGSLLPQREVSGP